MNVIERYAGLMSCNTLNDWCNLIFRIGGDLGYERTRFAILPDPDAPKEAENAFQHGNYPDEWISKYTAEKMHHYDPTFAHCLNNSIPLIWSPSTFAGKQQKEMYEEACGYGIRSGVTLPIHGPKGEMGILCLVSDVKSSKDFQQETSRTLPELSYLRDVIFESSLEFIRSPSATASPPTVTAKELECIKWCAAGKSSWDIARIMRCSEAAVNYHFSNLRRKFRVTSRQQVIVKAMRNGLL